jgi:methylmalonyl-CoA mutase C-terminal domain/subunit
MERGMHGRGRIKIIVAKLGLDIHWRGAVTVSRFLRDAGMEVVYLGNQFPEAIVAAAIEEDADVVGLSTLSGNHLSLGPEVARLLQAEGMDDVLVVIGGTIPAGDVATLKESGLDEVFGPNTRMDVIVEKIREGVRRKKRHTTSTAPAP